MVFRQSVRSSGISRVLLVKENPDHKRERNEEAGLIVGVLVGRGCSLPSEKAAPSCLSRSPPSPHTFITRPAPAHPASPPSSASLIRPPSTVPPMPRLASSLLVPEWPSWEIACPVPPASPSPRLAPMETWNRRGLETIRKLALGSSHLSLNLTLHPPFPDAETIEQDELVRNML